MQVLIFIILGVIIYKVFFVDKAQFKIKTFFRKGFKLDQNKFGIYCYCGKQGQGKTYSVVEFLKENENKKIYCNIDSISGIKYTPIHGFKELLELNNEHDCIIVFDEIFTALSKKSNRVNWNEVMSFLSQMRKRRIIFITTAQEWLEIDLTFRRYVRYQIQCSSRNLPFFNCGILKKVFCDVDDMIYDKDLMEYVAPPVKTVYSKYNKSVGQKYDTYEVIKVYS